MTPVDGLPGADSTRRWRVRGRDCSFREIPLVMGILNVTPDSFSDGGQWAQHDRAIEQGLALAEQGADVIDIGGESTRPGAAPVDSDEERRRVAPVIAELARRLTLPISIDTMKADVAQAALDAGAAIINDVSAGQFDTRMRRVCAASDCGVILMHMQGTPQTMQLNPQYDDVVRDVRACLQQRMDGFLDEGVAFERLMLDPGIGFGKTPQHNVDLLSQIGALHELDRPLLIGHSRKRFLEKLVGRPLDERLAGTIGVAIAVAGQGAEMVRVHDVRAVKDALLAWRQLAPPRSGSFV